MTSVMSQETSMGEHTHIEWTDHTFNPWYGCAERGAECDHCYARERILQLGLLPAWGAGTPRRRTAASTWAQPLRWDRQAAAAPVRRRVFCASWADVFDAEVDPSWRDDLWALIRQTPHLDWLLLTKRAQLIARMLPPDWGAGYPNVWLGVSVGQRATVWRVRALVRVPAAIHFVSAEPLLEPVTLPLDGVDWVIAGGESGRGCRPCDLNWIRTIRDDCAAAGVAFFYKQRGGTHYVQGVAGGCLLDGLEIKQLPTPPTPGPLQPQLFSA
jgi:protein gp37